MPLQLNSRGDVVREGIRQLECAALPTGLEWHVWWQEWSRHVEQKDGWERAIVDSITRLQKNQITLARMIRNYGDPSMLRYDSRGYVTGEESKDPAEFTREALSWFITQIRPALVTDAGQVRGGIPSWASILCRSVEGAYLQQARLGLELSAIRRKGYLTVNHSATVRNPDSFDQAGTETL